MTFPGSEWETKPPGDLGFDAEKLARVQRWLHEVAEDRPFQVGIARYGYLAGRSGGKVLRRIPVTRRRPRPSRIIRRFWVL